jgi:hypothetical protein
MPRMGSTALLLALAAFLPAAGCAGSADTPAIVQPEPAMTTEEPSRIGFFEEVLFSEWTKRSSLFNDYNDPPSYHVAPMDVLDGLPKVAQAKGLKLKGLVVSGPSGVLWTYHVVAFIEEGDGIRMNLVVFPHARLTDKFTGHITMEQFRHLMQFFSEAPGLKKGGMTSPTAASDVGALSAGGHDDFLAADWDGHEARLLHGNLRQDLPERKRILGELDSLINTLEGSAAPPVPDKTRMENENGP